MGKRKQGVKRLSIAVAVVTPVVVFFGICLSVNPDANYLWRIAGFLILCGFFAWGLIRLIAWLIDGFTKTSSEEKNKAAADSTAAR